jgi:predicted CXXCH cytochrome family protein
MVTKTVGVIIGAFVAALLAGAGAGTLRAANTQAPEGYAWAGACKDCHADIHAYWEKSKHGRAFGRLHGDNQHNACVGCHVTGVKQRVEVDGTLQNAGVQCEACHGPSAAHVANSMEKPPTRLPGPAVCEGCHNAKSPHYRGFVYQGMLKFGTHPVK